MLQWLKKLFSRSIEQSEEGMTNAKCAICGAETADPERSPGDKSFCPACIAQLSQVRMRSRSDPPPSPRLEYVFLIGFDHVPTHGEVQTLTSSDDDIRDVGDVGLFTLMLSGGLPGSSAEAAVIAVRIAKSHGRQKLGHDVDLAKLTYEAVGNLLVVKIWNGKGDTRVESSLSAEQQMALFVSVTRLHFFAHGLAGLSGFDKRTGTVETSKISPEVAEWAIPFAERIRDAENLFKTGKVTEAIARFEDVQNTIPNAAIVLVNIGVCHAEMGNRSLAQSWLNKALQVAPSEHRALIQENLRRLQSR